VTTVHERAAVCTVCQVHAESTFRVEGMDCHEEVALIARRLKRLSGLEAFSADVIAGRLHVQYDAARLTAGNISAAVADTGMRAWLEHEEPHLSSTSQTRFLVLVASGVSLAAAIVAGWFGFPIASRVFALTTVATGGAFPVARAWRAVRYSALDMNVLMTIAVVGAMVIGQWSEAATVVFLFAIAQHLESRSMDRARNAIRALMDLTPPDAAVVRNGTEMRVPVDQIVLGERLRVRPGEKIPLDGRVVAGASDVNQAPITGESLPVDKRPGDDVFAGTINGHGAMEVEATRLARDTTLARIIHLVESAQAERAPAQAFVDRFARVYTPVVIVFAALVAVVPPLLGWGTAMTWIYRGLVLLVIACPCALVIATPVALVSALAAAARHGVLIKGGLHLERLATVQGVAFDKTGTLTRGLPDVVDIIPVAGEAAESVLRLAASVEQSSEHPIAAAIMRAAAARSIRPAACANFRARPGLGALADVDRQQVLVGSAVMMADSQVDLAALADALDGQAALGRTVVVVARATRAIGLIALADTPRSQAHDMIELLTHAGLSRVAMLTGDSPAAALAIAKEVGIREVRASLLPADKVEAVKELRRQWGSLAMVGDGVNDAPALAAADVGIAMGAAGSDVALETADVALMGDDLVKLPFAIRLSRAALRTVRFNIAAALLLKLAFLGLAVGGYTSLWLAIVADTGMSLVVIANGLRLLRTT
jgi:Zn2+/Cd2+-exporting ATPase